MQKLIKKISLKQEMVQINNNRLDFFGKTLYDIAGL